MKTQTLPGLCCLLVLSLSPLAVQPADTLPGTKPLEWPEPDLSGRLMDGAHQFVERKMVESLPRRSSFWTRDFTSPGAYLKSVQTNRSHLLVMIGAEDPRLAARMERYGDEAQPALVAETSRYRIYQARWPVLDGLWGVGLLVQPKVPARAQAVLAPDAGQTPEQLMGLAPGLAPALQAGRRLAENGFELVLPATINREKLRTEDKTLRTSDQTHLEWIYRQAFHMGRHVIGFEAQTVMAAVDWFRAQHGANSRIGVCGYAEGGLTALYAAAADTRIEAALVRFTPESMEGAHLPQSMGPAARIWRRRVGVVGPASLPGDRA